MQQTVATFPINRRGFIRRILAFLLLAILAAGFFLYLMHAEIWHDESMYMSAGVLAQNNLLYHDFGYLQMPVLPYLYAAIFKLTQTSYLLLSMKLLNWIAVVAALLSFFAIARRLTRSSLYAGALLIVFALNSIFISTVKYMANAVMPLPFALLALYFFIRAMERVNRRGSLMMVLSGAMIGLAVGIKSYYIAGIPPMIFAALYAPSPLSFLNRIRRRVSVFCLGCGIALLPAVLFFYHFPDLFIWNNFRYHLLNSHYQEIQGYQRTMTFAAKADFAWDFLQLAPNLGILLAIAFGILCLRFDRLSWEWGAWKNRLFVPLILLTFAAAVVLKPLWTHYFVLPLPFVFIYSAALYQRLLPGSQKLVRLLIAVLAVFQCLLTGHNYYDRIPQNLNRPWQPLAFHKTAGKIAEQIGPLAPDDRIATMSPHYILEAGLPIYPEFATGLFIYRLGDLLTAEERKNYVTTSPQTAENFFDQDPPKAFLVGESSVHEAALVRYAIEKNYRCVGVGEKGLTLYIRPEGNLSTAPTTSLANATVSRHSL
ncbi:hypothetical protein JW992_00310 [candidate division KSB1 bacterium]|nr:hypothetical protein [candidate division KSB1 bacterium]